MMIEMDSVNCHKLLTHLVTERDWRNITNTHTVTERDWRNVTNTHTVTERDWRNVTNTHTLSNGERLAQHY